MSWNYRIMRHEYQNEVAFIIHEVYYKNNGEVEGWSENAASIIADDKDGAKWILEQMAKAIEKPVLDYVTGIEVK